MLESVAKEAPDAVEVHVQLATAYNRLKRKEDAERERAIVDRLNAEAQAKQHGAKPAGKGGSDDEARPVHSVNCTTLLLATPIPCLAQSAATSGLRRRRSPRAPAPPKPAASTASKRRVREVVNAATEARQAERWEEAIDLYAKAVKLKPDYVEGYWYQGTAYYTLDQFPQCRESFRKVVRLAPKNGARLRVPRPLRVRAQGIRPVAAAPAAVAHARRRRRAGPRRRRAISRRHSHDAHGAVRAGARDARRVRGRRQRQPARDRGDGHRHAADAAAADRDAAGSPRDGPDGRPRQLPDGDAQHRGRGARRSRRSSRAIRRRRTSTTPTACSCCRRKREKAIEEFKRELELQPEHPWSLMQMAFEYLKQGDAADRAAVGEAGRRGGAERVPRAQGARPGAARERRRRGRDPRVADGHQAGARESRAALHARARLSARRPAGRCGARARRVHAARPAGADAAKRRAVGGRADRAGPPTDREYHSSSP